MDDKKLVLGVTKRRWPTVQQLRFIQDLLTQRERLIVGWSMIALVVAITSMGVYHYFDTTELKPAQGGDYSEVIVGQPQYVNPILAQTNDVDLDLTRLLFSGLFERTADQSLEQDLVTDYTISEDQLTYTFYLRRDAKWHDDTPLTASDVVFTIQAIQDPTYNSPLEPSLRGVVVTQVDDYTFTLKLEEPFAPFLSSLTFGILPKHIWYDVYRGSIQNITLSEYNIRPIGSGPFQFDQIDKYNTGFIKSYSVVPFTNYYGDKPYLDRVTFRFADDQYVAADDLRGSLVDGIAFITPDVKADLVAHDKHLAYYPLQLPQYTAIFFNQKHSDVLANDTVRQALVWGVDRSAIIQQVLQGDGQPIYTPILPGYLGYNTEVEKYGFDIEKGKQILEDGDWKTPEGETYRKKGDQLLEFTIATVNQPEFLKTLDILKSNWEQMGAKVNINVYEAVDIQDQIIKTRNYEALLFGQVVGSDPDPYAFWHSKQMQHPGLALSVFYQKNIDDLLETARKTSDPEQRRLKYFNFQNILAEDLPAIFLYNPYYTYAVDDAIHGINSQYITTPSDRFADIVHWYRNTDRVKKSS